MTANRQQRRAEKTIVGDKPWPSMHGGTEQCGNCFFACDRNAHAEIVKRKAAIELAAGRPAPQDLAPDETYCMYDIMDVSKRVYGWCRRWSGK